MEEILASIRKIISEDADNGPPKQEAEPVAAATTNGADSTPPAATQEADVLELTHEVHEEPKPAEPVAVAPQPAPEPEPEPVAAPAPPAPEPAAPVEDDVVFVPKEEAPVSSPATDHDGIFSDKARKAIDDAFANLDQEDEPVSAPAARPAMAPVEGNSVEAVFERAVRDAFEPLLNQWMDGRKDDLLASMKPMIREWMDDHFPAILEGAVRDEVARAVKARGKR
jgi:hypothetical protein